MRTAELEIGTIVGDRYLVTGTLGVGGMARVLLAEDRQLGRPVALKVFQDGVADDADGMRRRDEVRLLAGLAHPGLVTLYDAVLDTEPAYLTMEYVAGETLAQRLARGPCSDEETRALVRTLAETLAFVHARGIVHRDIKPGNVLLPEDADGTGVPAKLADFGIARLVGDDRMTVTGTVIGTAAYLSPEQARGEPAGPASDVYALGLLMIECLTGRHPYPGTALESAVARLSRQPDLEDPALASDRTLLSRMTAADPTERPTAAEVAIAMSGEAPTTLMTPPDAATQAMPVGTTTEVLPPPRTPTAPTPVRRRTALLIAGVILASLALLAAIVTPIALLAARPPETTAASADRNFAAHVASAPAAADDEPTDDEPADEKPGGKPEKPGKPDKPGKKD